MSSAKFEEVDNVISSLGLTAEFEFVPFSKSRNAKASTQVSDLSVNWNVKLYRMQAPEKALQTDYMQGIGHLPKSLRPDSFSRYSVDEARGIRAAVESGKYRGTPLPAPLLRDVLYCLVADASALDAGSFEEWALDCGYDTDSRKAEATYRACLDIALKLRSLVGDTGIKALQAAFQDY